MTAGAGSFSHGLSWVLGALTRTGLGASMNPYRYTLRRGDIGCSRAVLWIMVNPSTADDVKDDQTIKKVVGFSHRYFPGDKVYVGNLFARRATDVRDLAQLTLADAVGPENDRYLCGMFAAATSVVFAWGSSAKLPVTFRDRWRRVDCLARALDHRPICFGLCADGHPRHPCMTGYDVRPEAWALK